MRCGQRCACQLLWCATQCNRARHTCNAGRPAGSTVWPLPALPSTACWCIPCRPEQQQPAVLQVSYAEQAVHPSTRTRARGEAFHSWCRTDTQHAGLTARMKPMGQGFYAARPPCTSRAVALRHGVSAHACVVACWPHIAPACRHQSGAASASASQLSPRPQRPPQQQQSQPRRSPAATCSHPTCGTHPSRYRQGLPGCCTVSPAWACCVAQLPSMTRPGHVVLEVEHQSC